MKKRSFVLILVLLSGLVGGYFLSVLLREATSVRKLDYQKMNNNDLYFVIDTATKVLENKDSVKYNELVELGKMKDSLLKVAGKIEAAIRAEKVDSIKVNLRSTLEVVDQLIGQSKEILMKNAIDLLSPINEVLTNLLREMKNRTDKLKQTVTNLEIVGDIITSITNILSSLPFAPADAPAN